MRSVRKITGRLGSPGQQIAAELKAAVHLLAENDVQNHQVRQGLVESLQGFLAAAVSGHLVAFLGDRVGVVGALVGVILDDRNCLCHQPLTLFDWRGL